MTDRTARGLKPYALKIRAGSTLAVDGAPPGETSSQIATDVKVPIWVRPEHEWLVGHLLRFWTETVAQKESTS